MSRQLATIRKISDVQPIPDADQICTYLIDGWTIVDRVGQYNIGDFVVMCEIDSWIPHHLAPFLSKGQEPREYEGIKGERLKTVKLRKQLSQGLILPVTLSILCDLNIHEGDDVTELLGIVKYEKPIPASLVGFARGNFPTFIPKTDQNRIQNCTRALPYWVENAISWEVTEKLDGTSCTIYQYLPYIDEGKSEFGVCSRNLDLKDTEGNTYWEVAKAADIHSKIASTNRNLAIQGEIIGNGIQDNQYKLPKHTFFCFDIFDIDNQKYFTPAERRAFCQQHDIDHVPVIHIAFTIENNSIMELLDMAEGRSYINDSLREGIVFKSNSSPDSFKAISNKWLLKHES
jgi:RNA ligase (TIGR02306 family)